MPEAYYSVPGFQLYLGNCVELMKSMPAECVDMVFADPPYMLSNGGFTVHAGKMVSVNKGDWDKSKGVDEDFAFHLAWIEQCRRVLKPGGTIWISGTYHSIYQCGYALQKLEYKILNDITWFKPNASPNLSGRYFTASHETLLWARKDPKARHTFNYQDMKDGDWHSEDYLKKAGKQMRSVWAVSPPKSGEKIHGKHPTQKPLALLERVVLAATNPGDLVLDPFSGSSTTGLAAAKHGREYVGMDSDGEYLELSKLRHKDIVAAQRA
ncbi:MAG TPA: site-specific DNA-methyltransferase [Candidatus Saccharimonadales bacterium]